MYKGFSRLHKASFTSILVVLFLVPISTVVNGQSPQTEATRLIAEAKSLREKNDRERALATIQKAISLDPRNPDAHVQLAMIYSTLENEEKARLAVAEALRIDPNYAPAHQQRAAQLRRAKDYEGAVREAKLALSLKPDAEFEANSHLTLGLTYAALNRNQLAADEFREVIRINPNDGYAYDSLSRALFEMSNFQDAETALRRTIELTPQNTSAYHNLAAALQNLGRVEEAIRYYQEYLRLEPKVANRADIEQRIVELKAAEPKRLGFLLIKAGREGDVTQIEGLLQKGADVNYVNYGVTPLSAVAESGRLELVKLLLAKGAKDDNGAAIAVAYERGFNEIELLLESKIPKPRSAESLSRVLLVAVAKGDITKAQAMLKAGADEKDRALDSALDQKVVNAGMVRLLLDEGANANPTGVKRTPLMLAAYKGDVELVKLLLAKGANVNARGSLWSNEDQTALSVAVGEDHRETVKVLLNAGADATDKQLLWLAARAPLLNYDDPRLKNAPRPSAEILRLLLDKGAKVSGPAGDSALLVANSADKVKLLLTNGANPNAKGQYGGSALHAAASYADFERIGALLEAGAEVNAKDSYGNTALHALLYKSEADKQATTKDYARAVKALLRNKSIDVNAKNKDGETALMGAVSLNNAEVVRLLLAARSDTNEANVIGDTAFSLAYAEGNSEIEKILSGAGPQRLTPAAVNAFLVAAIKKKDLAKVKELLDKGADPNHKFSLGLRLQGTTNIVLVLAAQVGHAGIVQTLLDKGADVNAEGLLGGSESGLKHGTALQAAKDPEVVEVLRNAKNKKN